MRGEPPAGERPPVTVPAPAPEPGGPLSAVMIGEQPLLVACAEQWTARGHRVAALVSPDPDLRAWAERGGVPALGRLDEIEDALGGAGVDYLFSIANLRIVPQRLLDLPRRLPVNFHDALLPRHAGVHATSWALLDASDPPARHGVTWHVMTEGADEGDVLLQRPFDVTGDDTAYSLNVKCFQAASESFGELADLLAEGRETRTPQDLRRRTYHGPHDVPPDGGVLRWTRGGAALHALVRATSFGRTPNTWGTAKIAGPGDFAVVTDGHLPGTRAALPPGTILAAADDALTVATSDLDLVLTGLRTPSGEHLPPPVLLARWGLTVGDALPEPPRDEVTAWAEGLASARRHEAHWVRRLARAQPLELPYRTSPPGSGGGPRPHEVVEVPVAGLPAAAAHAEAPAPPGASGGPTREGVPAAADGPSSAPPGPAHSAGRAPTAAGGSEPLGPADALLAAVLLFLARVGAGGGGRDVTLLAAPPEDAGPLVAAGVPLRVPEAAPGRDFAGFAREVADAVAGVRTRGGAHARDVWTRYPALAAASPLAPDVSVTVGRDLPDALGPAAATVVVDPAGDRCRWVLDPGQVDTRAASALAADFSSFLAALAKAPWDVADVPLLSGARWRQVVEEWNDTAVRWPATGRVDELVAEQARRRPDALAVVGPAESLDYRELDARAERVAASLRGAGAGPGALVGVHLGRSADLVAGLLGVMKSGAAYVPLDPVYPPDRIRAMVEDAGVRLLLTDPDRTLPPLDGVARLDIRAAHGLSAPGPTPPPQAVSPSGGDLAYVIYTSGSTGRPKGVRVTHRALTNFLHSMAREPGCGPGDRLLAVTTVCFDIAGLELFLPLISGGSVEVVPEKEVGDGFALGRRIARSGATMMQATPATWRMLVAAGWEGRPGLRVLCGGEALPGDLAREILGRVEELWNLYGPTETTVWSAATRIRAGERVTLGRPIANTRFHVMDGRGRPLPPYVPGELYIGGAGVADGYHGRPELTAEKFVPDTVGPAAAGERLYRTGDLVRYLGDGRLEYLDRLDNQVKVHGYRIEPGEIEAALTRHPAVRQAVVVTRDDPLTGGRRLVGYVVPDGAAAADGVDPGELRRHLARDLPGYMIPALFVRIPEVPLTRNGKVDRKALPEPPRATGRTAPGAVPPGGAEGRVAAVWSAVLGHDAIGLDDNFFDAGGDSLRLVEVVRRLSDGTGVTVTSVDMFRSPTVRGMAAHLAARTGETSPAAAAPTPARRRIDRSRVVSRRTRS